MLGYGRVHVIHGTAQSSAKGVGLAVERPQHQEKSSTACKGKQGHGDRDNQGDCNMHPCDDNGPDQLEQLLGGKAHPLEITGQDMGNVGAPGPQEA